MKEGAGQAEAIIAFRILLSLGGGLVLIYLLFTAAGQVRSYLLYLGLGFVGLAMTVWNHVGVFRIPMLLISLVIFGFAFVEAVREMKERIAKMREEEHDREEAFAELMTAVAHKPSKPATVDVGTETPSAPPVEPDSSTKPKHPFSLD